MKRTRVIELVNSELKKMSINVKVEFSYAPLPSQVISKASTVVGLFSFAGAVVGKLASIAARKWLDSGVAATTRVVEQGYSYDHVTIHIGRIAALCEDDDEDTVRQIVRHEFRHMEQFIALRAAGISVAKLLDLESKKKYLDRLIEKDAYSGQAKGYVPIACFVKAVKDEYHL